MYTVHLTMALITVWVGCYWSDPELRRRYPGLLYVPEPWTVKGLPRNNGYIIKGFW